MWINKYISEKDSQEEPVESLRAPAGKQKANHDSAF